MEIWKDVIGYNGMYQVSSIGRIKSFKRGSEKILKTNLDLGGYPVVNLCNKGKMKTRTVHQLVAIAFLNHIPSGRKMVVNHKNFNRQDNRVDNLEIVTMRENLNKKHYKGLTSRYTGVSWHKPLKKWKSAICINCKVKHLGYYENEYDAHLAYQNKLSELNG